MPIHLDAQGTAHRPWALPDRPWSIAMRWLDLAFLHRPVRPALLRAHVPAGLELDTFDGSAWLGSVPFRMEGVRPRRMPAVPGISDFPELNLRTYVTAQGKPGVWFFSLDVTGRLAVAIARTWFHLPYHRARMSSVERDAWIESTHARDERVAFRARYRGIGAPFRAAPGSLEAFLVERYCLYASDRRGRILRGDVHHAPWTLQRAECELELDTLAAQVGLGAAGGDPLAHFAHALDVVAWSLAPLA